MGILDDKQGIQKELRESFADLNIDAPITSTLEVTLPMPAEADLAGGANVADTVAKVNALLGKLRTAGLLDT